MKIQITSLIKFKHNHVIFKDL